MVLALLIALVAVPLTADASSRAKIALKTYTGQTAWQKAQVNQVPPGRREAAKQLHATIKVSRRGVEVVEGMDGPCGSITFHAIGTTSAAWPVSHGTFNHKITGSGYIRGHITSKRLTGSYSPDGSEHCLTTFTLKRQA